MEMSDLELMLAREKAGVKVQVPVVREYRRVRGLSWIDENLVSLTGLIAAIVVGTNVELYYENRETPIVVKLSDDIDAREVIKQITSKIKLKD